jgi:Protein of unknown function (DUF2752)
MALTLRESFADTTRIDLKAVRTFSAGMLAFAAIRPLLPVEVVPPCPLRTITGVPCPLCGMTRGVTAAVHGNLGHALFLNPGSIAAVLLALAVLLAWRTRRVTVRVWIIVAALGLLWSWQLFKYFTGRPL